MNALRAAHTRALHLARTAVAAVRPEQLELPTPCADWSLRTLLEHMIGQNHGFAAAARGRGEQPGIWADHPFDGLPDGPFRRSADELAEAFAAADRPFLLPQIRVGVSFPARQAIGFHLLDTLVHGWDVAVSIGAPYLCPEPDAVLLLAIAAQVPADRPPGGHFAAVRKVGPGKDFDRALALLGRDPERWRTR